MTSLSMLTEAVADLAEDAPKWVADCTDPEARDIAHLFATVKEAREALQKVERELEYATANAMVADTAEDDTLRVERSRRPDRKSWQHAEWQAEARRKAIQKAGLKGAVLITADGEESDQSLEALIREVQEVHGATAPKVTPLRGLGIDPDDYCERTPGAWAVKVTRMADEGAKS